MGRTNIEQRLKREIGEKNALARQLHDRLSEIERYRRAAGQTANRRWQKRYTATAERLSGDAARMRERVLRLASELERRIHEELNISEDEVREFQQRYEKELAEYRAAFEKAKRASEEWQLAERTWKSASPEQQEKLRQAEAQAARAAAAERREKKDVEKVGREIDSEMRDRAFFMMELAKIAAERAPLKG